MWGGRPRFNPWVGKILWRKELKPTPVFLPGEFHGQRNLEGYSPWGYKELDTTEWLTLFHIFCIQFLYQIWAFLSYSPSLLSSYFPNSVLKISCPNSQFLVLRAMLFITCKTKVLEVYPIFFKSWYISVNLAFLQFLLYFLYFNNCLYPINFLNSLIFPTYIL